MQEANPISTPKREKRESEQTRAVESMRSWIELKKKGVASGVKYE